MAKNSQKTPLLQLIKNNGGTLYVFPSASEDIGLNLNYNANTVGLSHYALLNIPISKTIVDSDSWLSNRFNPTIIPGHFEYCSKINSAIEDKPSWHIAASLQNYAMNFETLLVNQDTYNYKDYHTVSEKVFWKWLKSTGAIRWKNVENAVGFYEEGDGEAENKNLYNRVVQCFGAIDSGSSLSSGFGMFNEVYVNIPTSYGSGKVFFSCSDENNYHLNRKYYVSNADYLEGREKENNNVVIYTTNQPFADTNSSTDEYYDTTCDTSALYKDVEIKYNPDTKDDTTSSDGSIIKNRLSTLDGVEIVKDLSTISQIFNAVNDSSIGSEINSFDEINIDRKYTTLKEGVYTFDFNAILLYYSVYDNNDNTSDTALSTNLFGILFLDKPTEVSGSSSNTGALTDFYIPTLTKKQSSTDGGFGTGYSFRINIRTQSVYDNQDSIINDNTTQTSVDAENFNDVLYALNQAVANMNTNVETTKVIQEKYTQILGYYGKQAADISDLNSKIDAYINGERGDILSTNRMNASLFTSPNNKISFGFDNGAVDSRGNTVYDVLTSIDSSGNIDASSIKTNQNYSKDNFVYVENCNVDKTVDSSNNVLESFFNEGNFIIRDSQTRYSGFTNVGLNPQGSFYIDSDSSIFKLFSSNTKQGEEDKDNRFLKKEDGVFKGQEGELYTKSYVNYVNFIPYIIAELINQRVKIRDLEEDVKKLKKDSSSSSSSGGDKPTQSAEPTEPSSEPTSSTPEPPSEPTTSPSGEPSSEPSSEPSTVSETYSVSLKVNDLNKIESVSAHSLSNDNEIYPVEVKTNTTTSTIDMNVNKKYNNLVANIKTVNGEELKFE